MDKKWYILYRWVSKYGWWHVARRHILKKLISKYVKNSSGYILDVGCADGESDKELLTESSHIPVGIDISIHCLNFLKQEKFLVAGMSATHLGFKNDIFISIIASDVLEHIENQTSAIAEFRRVLKKDGIIICFVPASNSLWSPHDVIVKHYRRYTEKELVSLFQNNGFKILLSGYWNFILFFPYILLTKILRITHRDNDSIVSISNKLTNTILKYILYLENMLILHNIHLPVGISCFIVAKKV